MVTLMEEKLDVHCKKCKKKYMTVNRTEDDKGQTVEYGFCDSCKQDKRDETYLDNGSFSHVDERIDRPREPQRDYDDSWQSELYRDGVYE